MKLFILSVFSLLLVTTVYAQKPFFGPMPNLAKKHKFMLSPTATDSITYAIRPVANIAAYGEPGNILMAGAGFGYNKLDYNYTTQVWKALWSINAIAFAGGTVAPTFPPVEGESVLSVALMGGFYNNLIQVGPMYNVGSKKFGVAVSLGINFNNQGGL